MGFLPSLRICVSDEIMSSGALHQIMTGRVCNNNFDQSVSHRSIRNHNIDNIIWFVGISSLASDNFFVVRGTSSRFLIILIKPPQPMLMEGDPGPAPNPGRGLGKYCKRAGRLIPVPIPQSNVKWGCALCCPWSGGHGWLLGHITLAFVCWLNECGAGQYIDPDGNMPIFSGAKPNRAKPC